MESQPKPLPAYDLLGVIEANQTAIKEQGKQIAEIIRNYKEIKHDLEFEKKFSSKLAEKNNDLKKELEDLQLSFSLFKNAVAKKFTTVKCEE